MYESTTALIALNNSLINQNLSGALNNLKIQVKNKLTINTKESILSELENHKPNYLFVSSELAGVSDLLEMISKAKQISPKTKIVLTINEHDAEKILNYLLANVDAILWTENIYESLVLAINQVAKGQSYLCGKTVNELKKLLLQQNSKGEIKFDLGLLGLLTDREIEVLYSLTQGVNYKQISKILFISESTVKTHVNNIFTKLNVNDRTQAVLYALKHGIESTIKKPHLLNNLTNETVQK